MTRTLVVSLDGATLDLVGRWRGEDRMPALASIMDDGSFGPMRSTFPFNSAVAWTSLATGVTAGRHGIYDFFLLRDGGYGLRPATSADRLAPALWTVASEAGARVGVINVPVTYPAEPVNGVMVSGLDTPTLDQRAVHPASHLERVRRVSPDYVIVSKARRAATIGDFGQVERELMATLRARMAVAADLAQHEDLDLLVLNLETTEKSHHFFWQHHDPTHPRHDPRADPRWRDAIGRTYQTVDGELQRLMDVFAPDTVFVLSDRGAGPSRDWVLFMNDWLAAEGFMTIAPAPLRSALSRVHRAAIRGLSVPARRRLRSMAEGAVERAKDTSLYGGVDWSRTRAYAQMRSSVRANRWGREAQGVVAAGHVEALMNDVADAATGLTLPSGEPVFSTISPGRDVYPGSVPGGPDLVLFLDHGLQVKGRNLSGRGGYLQGPQTGGAYLPSGVHTDVGMVVAAGSGVARRGMVAETDIRQAGPSILAAMGIASPPVDVAPFPFVATLDGPPSEG